MRKLSPSPSLKEASVATCATGGWCIAARALRRSYGSVSNCLSTLERTLANIRKAHPAAELRVCYEAGPTGFVIARRLAQLGIDCTVVAASLIPTVQEIA